MEVTNNMFYKINNAEKHPQIKDAKIIYIPILSDNSLNPSVSLRQETINV
jgi:hypothetical protein